MCQYNSCISMTEFLVSYWVSIFEDGVLDPIRHGEAEGPQIDAVLP